MTKKITISDELIEDYQLQLLLGLPICTPEFGYIHSPTLEEIAVMGYSNYSELMSTLLINKDMFTNVPEEVTEYELLVYLLSQDENKRRNFVDACKLVLKEDVGFHVFNDIGEVITIGSDRVDHHINKDNFFLFQTLIYLVSQNKYEKDEAYNPANEAARKAIEEMLNKKKKKKNVKPRKEVNFNSLISLVMTLGNYRSEDIRKLNIYQFMDRYKRLEIIENYRNTYLGVYTGNIDTKKANIKQVNWSKVID